MGYRVNVPSLSTPSAVPVNGPEHYSHATPMRFRVFSFKTQSRINARHYLPYPYKQQTEAELTLLLKQILFIQLHPSLHSGFTVAGSITCVGS